MSALKLLKKKGKDALKDKTPSRAPVPTPDLYEAIEQEATYDDFEAKSSDEDIYDAPNDKDEEAPKLPKLPKVPQRLKKVPIPEPEEDVYEAPDEESNTSGTDESDASAEPSDSPKLPTPPPPRKKDKENKKSKLKLAGHGVNLNAIQGVLQNLKGTKAAKKQKSEEEKEPPSPKILTPVKDSKAKGKNVASPTSEPESPHRPLPAPPPSSPPPVEKNTSDSSTEIRTNDTALENGSRSTPPLPARRDFEDDANPYNDAVSDPLSTFPWFHGDISREEGQKRVLSMGSDGTFLVRQSTKCKNQPYTMVLLYKGHVNNLKVRHREDGRYALGEEKPNEIHFESVSSMVDYHQRNSVNLTGGNKGETTLKETPKLKT